MLSRPDRFRAWLVTGPLGRGAAFAINLLVVLVGVATRGRLGGPGSLRDR